ncbi:hypothetical protein ALP29_200308 [Pseudomonas syringae pv. avii]|uniref:Uncharacterized protein n=1 Tax=Pseudomonas syringae pv. avii TaxID=663959 RepID=A0A3M5W8F2_PSESX|nr:hypothetical protein ALP29_200308 [Pseudomonas syringae pv. avii]
MVTTAEWAANNAAGNYDLTYKDMTRADPIILQTIIDPRSANSSTLATNLYSPQTLPKALELFDAGLTATRSEQRAARKSLWRLAGFADRRRFGIPGL